MRLYTGIWAGAKVSRSALPEITAKMFMGLCGQAGATEQRPPSRNSRYQLRLNVAGGAKSGIAGHILKKTHPDWEKQNTEGSLLQGLTPAKTEKRMPDFLQKKPTGTDFPIGSTKPSVHWACQHDAKLRILNKLSAQCNH